MKIWMNGKLVKKADAKISVFDHGVLYGDGVFEGIRIYSGRVFECQAHIDRLFDSAKEIRLAIPQTKQELIDAIDETMQANDIVEGYVRLVVTRGPGTLGVSPFTCPTPNVFIIADQIALYPEEVYEKGLAVIIAKAIRMSARMLKPSIKSLNYLNNIVAKIEAVETGVGEAIMLNEQGNLAECTADNVFIVKDGQVITPPHSAGILGGITRRIVIVLAGRLGIPMLETDIAPQDVYVADECFLTGTGAEVISVTKVDSKAIGDGKPGPITRKLLEAFRSYIQSGEEL